MVFPKIQIPFLSGKFEKFSDLRAAQRAPHYFNQIYISKVTFEYVWNSKASVAATGNHKLANFQFNAGGGTQQKIDYLSNFDKK